MVQDPKILDVVALVEALPERGLVRGRVGTVVEQFAPDVFEIEFSDEQARGGRTPRRLPKANN